MAIDWNSETYVNWLRQGISQLRHPEREATWHLAFAPLRFSPASAVLGQLESFFVAVARHDPPMASDLRLAVEDYFDRWGLAHWDRRRTLSEGEAYFVNALWRLYAALNPTRSLTPHARRFLAALNDIEGRPVDDVVHAVITAVASTPPCTPLFALFDALHANRRLWSDDLVVFLVDLRLSDPEESPDQSWLLLLAEYRQALHSVTNPKTPLGRALLQEIAHRVRPEEEIVEESLTALSAARLWEGLGLAREQAALSPRVPPQKLTSPTSQSVDEHSHLRRVLLQAAA